MNKILKFSFLLVLFSFCFAIADVDAQNYGKKRKKKKKKPEKTEKKSEKTDDYFDESGNFASHLWYGGGFTLGFSGNNVSSSFAAGITPMVGYKIIDQFSVGPVAGIQYNYLKGYATDGNIHKGNAFSWSIGAFSRYKFFRSFFAHVEYGIENNEYFLSSGGFLVLDQNGNLATVRQQYNNFYGGLGYSSGGDLIAFEMYIVYNFIDRLDDIYYNPFIFRFGITYKF